MGNISDGSFVLSPSSSISRKSQHSSTIQSLSVEPTSSSSVTCSISAASNLSPSSSSTSKETHSSTLPSSVSPSSCPKTPKYSLSRVTSSYNEAFLSAFKPPPKERSPSPIPLPGFDGIMSNSGVAKVFDLDPRRRREKKRKGLGEMFKRVLGKAEDSEAETETETERKQRRRRRRRSKKGDMLPKHSNVFTGMPSTTNSAYVSSADTSEHDSNSGDSLTRVPPPPALTRPRHRRTSSGKSVTFREGNGELTRMTRIREPTEDVDVGDKSSFLGPGLPRNWTGTRKGNRPCPVHGMRKILGGSGERKMMLQNQSDTGRYFLPSQGIERSAHRWCPVHGDSRRDLINTQTNIHFPPPPVWTPRREYQNSIPPNRKNPFHPLEWTLSRDDPDPQAGKKENNKPTPTLKDRFKSPRQHHSLYEPPSRYRNMRKHSPIPSASPAPQVNRQKRSIYTSTFRQLRDEQGAGGEKGGTQSLGNGESDDDGNMAGEVGSEKGARFFQSSPGWDVGKGATDGGEKEKIHRRDISAAVSSPPPSPPGLNARLRTRQNETSMLTANPTPSSPLNSLPGSFPDSSLDMAVKVKDRSQTAIQWLCSMFGMLWMGVWILLSAIISWELVGIFVHR